MAARRREFNGERDSIEAPTNSGYFGQVRFIRRERRVHGSRPRDEQLHGAGTQDFAGRVAVVGDVERRDAVDQLAVDPQHFPACGKDPHARTSRSNTHSRRACPNSFDASECDI
jgi:hypothetical protein